MSIILNDNIKINAGKPAEAKFLNFNTNTPYTSVSQVNSVIPISERYVGLTVLINDQEYWYRDGVFDVNLILKTVAFTGTTSTGERLEKQFYQVSHGFDVGEVVEYSGGTFIKALAIGGRDSEVIGLVNQVIDADIFKVVLSGYISGISGLTLSANTTYYLSSNVAGSLTPIEPILPDTISKPILTTLTDDDAIVFQYREILNSTGATVGSGFTYAQNIGNGEGEIYSGIGTGSVIDFRTIKSGNNIGVVTSGDTVILNFTGTTASNTLASNGLTKLGDTIVLGGTLTGSTTINTSGNNLLLNYGTTFESGDFPIITATVGGSSNIPHLRFKNNNTNNLSTGLSDIAIGPNNLNGSSVARGNISIGQNNLSGLTATGEFQGGRNIAIGYDIASKWTTPASNKGTHNVLLGRKVLRNTSSNYAYSFVSGYEAGANITGTNTTLESHVIIGTYALNSAVINNGPDSLGRHIIAIGTQAGYQATFPDGFASILLGYNSGFQAGLIEDYNILIGGAARNTRSYGARLGRGNIAIGERAAASSSGGTQGATGVGTNQFNVFIGVHAGEGGGPNEKSVWVGTEAGQGFTSGSKNVGIGSWSLNQVSGSHNTALGGYAGYYGAYLTPRVTGFGNTFIGASSGIDPSNLNVNQVTVIGAPVSLGDITGYRPVATSGNMYLGSIGDIELRSSYNSSPQKLTLSSNGGVLIGSLASTLTTNAILDLQSTTRAFIPPRMSTVQRDAITSPSAGMMIYNTNTSNYNYHNGSVWGEIGSTSGTSINKLAVAIISANYTATTANHVILVDTTASRTITLPSSPLDGQVYHIKDKSGSALTNNITISGNGNNIDGSASALINTDYGSLYIVYSSAEDAWFTLGFIG